MRTFSETLEAVTDGDATTSLRETMTGDVKLRSFKVVGRSNPFAKRSLGPRFGDDGVQDQLEQVAQGTWEGVAAHQDLTHLPPRAVGQLPGVERQQLLKDLEALAVNHGRDRKSTRLNSSHVAISYAVFCVKKKKHEWTNGAARQETKRDAG